MIIIYLSFLSLKFIYLELNININLIIKNFQFLDLIKFLFQIGFNRRFISIIKINFTLYLKFHIPYKLIDLILLFKLTFAIPTQEFFFLNTKLSSITLIFILITINLSILIIYSIKVNHYTLNLRNY